MALSPAVAPPEAEAERKLLYRVMAIEPPRPLPVAERGATCRPSAKSPAVAEPLAVAVLGTILSWDTDSEL